MRSDLHFSADDPRFIDRLSEYCDRWCERCTLTERCASHALVAASAGQTEAQRGRNDAFWKGMQESLDQALALLEPYVTNEWEGPAATDVDRDGADRASGRRDGALLAAASLAYAERVHVWFDITAPTIAGGWTQGGARTADLAPVDATGAAAIAEAIEVIQRHVFQIHVKLMRAQPRLLDEIDADEFDEDDFEWRQQTMPWPPRADDPLQNDANGSVKVALIAIDRSIAAWGRLWQSLGDDDAEILGILVGLAELRRDVEATFPHARSFVRPGFDESR